MSGAGNLMHRASNITKKYCGGKVPDLKASPSFDLLRLIAETAAAAEITSVLACALIVCAAAVPCYYLAVHKQFVSSLIRSSHRA